MKIGVRISLNESDTGEILLMAIAQMLMEDGENTHPTKAKIIKLAKKNLFDYGYNCMRFVETAFKEYDYYYQENKEKVETIYAYEFLLDRHEKPDTIEDFSKLIEENSNPT